jgi:hypothetical protein
VLFSFWFVFLLRAHYAISEAVVFIVGSLQILRTSGLV